MNLLIVAIAPVSIIAVYIYIRDKYEKEPVGLLLKTLAAGMIIVLPILGVETFLSKYQSMFSGYSAAAYKAFIVAATSEEVFKFLALYILIWNNKNFDELFDGIVYAVFVSLGFALVENIMYVFQHGMQTGISRAITAVPAHALFGVTMGYYFGFSKYLEGKKFIMLFMALFAPILLHGVYDFILFTGHPYLFFAFVPFIVYLWISGFKKIKRLSIESGKQHA